MILENLNGVCMGFSFDLILRFFPTKCECLLVQITSGRWLITKIYLRDHWSKAINCSSYSLILATVSRQCFHGSWESPAGVVCLYHAHTTPTNKRPLSHSG